MSKVFSPELTWNMAEPRDPVDEFHRIRATAAEARAQVMHSQIAFGVTLCRVAETELEYGHFANAEKILERLRKLAEGVHRHLDEPHHVPPKEIDVVRAELVELESQILAVEQDERRS